MNKKLLFLSPLNLFIPALSLSSCNILEARDKREYIKSINSPNYIKSGIVNNNGFISNDNDSLLSAPLIRFKTEGRARFDKLNKKFFDTTSKSLEFNLAKEIIINKLNGEKVVYNKDYVAPFNSPSPNGINRVYTNQQNNINNPQFLKDLSEAKNIEFKLKENIYFVDKKANKTDLLVNQEHYKNSYLYKDNIIILNKLLKEHGLFEIDLNNPLKFTLQDSENNKFTDFVTNVITTNLIFNPLYSKEPNEKEFLFASPYVLNKNLIDSAEYIKNNHYAISKFAEDTININKVILKFNPVPIDLATYRLQIFNAFRQNLISEADFNLFNISQKNEINNFPKIYGLNFTINKPQNTNTNEYFINLNIHKAKNKKFNDAFSMLVFGEYDKKLSQENVQNIYKKESFSFFNLLHNLWNQYTGIKILGYQKYWNSFMPQSMFFDTPYNKKIMLYESIDDINEINIDYFNKDANRFETDRTNFIDYGKKQGLQSSAYSDDKIIDISKQIKGLNYEKYKKLIKEILDDFYEKNKNLIGKKIEWVIPVYSQKSIKVNEFYDRLINIIKQVDNRLNPSFEYANKNDNSYIYSHNTYTLTNNSFAENIMALLSLENHSILKNIAFFIKNYKNSDLKPNYYNHIDKLDKIISSLIGEKYIDQIINLINSDNIFKILLEKNKIEYFDIRKKIIKTINKLNKNEQFQILKAVDNLLFIRQNETAYLFANEYEKIIVQHFYNKPLNDLGFTYYQDIQVFS
ncbi:OppA family ABC transporter substrate-binding lipoprotein [Mycoplasma tauri]|uniref:OppA family ABC transporter substrate-binding lipoprotein n=3 Tax=Mycoplasma tauri TaxID=547987 RepID=UPI001CBF1A5A|nr:hypothetical protein [Mycoplasma tauri]MBZ4226662.1 hypothetical protein [Mycoplasma tauri]